MDPTARDRIRARALRPEPSLFGDETVLALLDAHDRLRSHYVRFFVDQLRFILTEEFEDHASLFEEMMHFDPSLPPKILAALSAYQPNLTQGDAP
jgi:hypothetical protein